MNCVKKLTAALLLSLPAFARAGEADIRIPDLGQTSFLGGALSYAEAKALPWREYRVLVEAMRASKEVSKHRGR